MTGGCLRFTWKSPHFEFEALVWHQGEDSPEGVDWPQLAAQIEKLMPSVTNEVPRVTEWSWVPSKLPPDWPDTFAMRLENAALENSPHPSNSTQSPPGDSDTHLE